MGKKSNELAKGFAEITRLPQPPKRTEVPEDKAREFETAGQGAIKPSPKTSRLRRNAPGTRVAIYLPPDIEQQLRVRCATDRRSISDAVTDAVSMWLQG